LKQLQEDHEALAGHTVFKADLPSLISEVTQRVASHEDMIGTLRDQLEPLQSLNADVVELKGHEVFRADLPSRTEQFARRLSSKEEAMAGLEMKLQEASRGSTTGEDSIRELTQELEGLRVELGSSQSSVKLLSAKIDQVQQAQPVASSGMEHEIRELQTQMAQELDVLARQRLELTELRSGSGPLGHGAAGGAVTADREIEDAAEHFSKQVLAELQDLRDHQQELGKLRTAVLSSGVKGDNEEGTKKEESTEIENVLKRMRSGEVATTSLEQRLEQLRSDYEDLEHSKGGGGGNDVGQQVSIVLDRITAGDKKVAALQQAMEAPIRALEQQLRQMQNERGPADRWNLEMVMHRSAENEEANMVLQKQLKELRNANREMAQGTESAIKLLAGKVEQMMQKTGLEATATDSLGQVQKLAKTGSLGPEQVRTTKSTQMELHIRELQQQVHRELECLARHQRELMESRATAEQESASTSNGVTVAGSSGVEARMETLSKQVSAELSSFAEQQAELGQARATVEGLGQQLKDLQEQFKDLRDRNIGNPSDDRAKDAQLAERVSEVLQRISQGEDRVVALQRQLEQPIKALEKRLGQLQHDHETLRASTEGNNRASALSVRKSEASSVTKADGTHQSKEMETRVKDLHEQVARELESLAHYQQELEHARPSLSGGEIKQAVKQLSEQVLAELRELQDHQHELGKFRAVMAGLPQKPGSESGQDELPRMEAKA